MFQFGRFPYLSLGMTRLEPRRVSPFGYLRLLRSYTPHRSFSQYNTSFIGTKCLGIHCVPLFAFRTIVRSRRLSWHALIGITFALIIQLLRRTRQLSGESSGFYTLRCIPALPIHNQRPITRLSLPVETRGLAPSVPPPHGWRYPFPPQCNRGALYRDSCPCGDKGTRTPDLLGASEALSQLSYVPIPWGWQDLNLRPHAYQACALTN